MSKLFVDNIASKTGGTDALTIDSSGRVTIPNVTISNRPYALADFGGSGYVSKPNGSTLIFDNATHNDGNHYNTATGLFTCPLNGLYTVQGNMLSQNTTDSYEIWVVQNGVVFSRAFATYRALDFSTTVKCTAGQTLNLAIGTTTPIYEGTGTSRYSFVIFTYIG